MDQNESNRTDRRAFLQAGALATASALAAGPSLAAQEAAPKSSELPRRPLGKTGATLPSSTWGRAGVRTSTGS